MEQGPDESADPSADGGSAPTLLEVLRVGVWCAWRVALLLCRRQLHIHREREGETVELADGRRFLVYRATSSSAVPEIDEGTDGDVVTLAVWFRLWAVPPGARLRAYLFERESLLNTVLFAGCVGYRTKLWSVDRDSNEYAGFYTWDGQADAERYRRYITAILRPLSVRGSVGGRVDQVGSTPTWRVVTDPVSR